MSMTFHGQSIATGGGSEEPIDKILYDRYFQGKTNGRAIECGANDGLFLSTCLVFEEMGWTVFNIEASINNFHRLIDNRPNSVNMFYALSDSDFQVVGILNYNGENGGMNGIDKFGDVVSRFGQPVSTTKARTIRYDTLFRGEEEIDLLVLDIEGHELAALEGMTINTPKVICIEHTRHGIEAISRALCEYRLDFSDPLNAIYVR